MFSFKGFQTQDKNTHLEHLEDDIINRGSVGGENAINFLKSVRDMLAGKGSATNITVKWDGAPAIICGINPENGKFFVGTKSVFNKTPLINYTERDIKVNHANNANVVSKLIICLRYLKGLNIKGILQGDLLFTDDVKSVAIEGEKMLSFTPNTITYAVPVDSDIGRRIAKAKMGIVFHTQYNGKDMKSLSASFGTVTGSTNRNVLLASAAYKDTTGVSTFNQQELAKFDAQIRMAEGSLSKAKPILDLMSSNVTDQLSVAFRLKTYFNYYIKNSNAGMAKVKTMQDQFRDYYENFINMEIDSKNTPRGKEKYIKAKEEGLKLIDRNRNALYFAIASHITLGNAKNTLLQKMNQIQSIGHFLKTNNGYRVTAPEGYVAVDKVAGAVKFVDRLEFSRQNFTMPKGWN